MSAERCNCGTHTKAACDFAGACRPVAATLPAALAPTEQQDELPPLPPAFWQPCDGWTEDYYTAKQMRAYALDTLVAALKPRAAALATPLAPTPAAAELRAVLAFLDGSAPLDGVHFGEKHPTERGAFWWRKHLRAAIAAAPLPRQAAVQDEDTARLDWLEQAAESLGGLMLHDGQHPAPGRNGLGLRYMGRTLRQAVDSVRGVNAAKSAPATSEEGKP